ncbi:uncharacterized protein PAC_05371 [Phialocephala subalpina]|uniref:Rhodopsin domain-containing protein n=1 Tax=Phialocephala subalpina TaxID=576137 RepID=A0A1L7WRU4_9HELO|nr:uncharacterized protein PAC_05371 [Phialocephala subalpina]
MSDPTPKGAVPPPPGVVPDFQNPQDVLYTISLVTQILCLSIVTPIVWLKIYARARIQKVMYREDWCCLAAWVCPKAGGRRCTDFDQVAFLGYMTTNLLFDRYGGGFHAWEVTKEDMTNFMIVSYAGLLVYGPCAFLIKCSLLLISTRLFAPFPRAVFAVQLFMLLMLLYYIPMQFVKILICDPISDFWFVQNPKCFNQHSIYLADTTVSVITDFAVLVIPMPLMWLLHLPVKRRLRVIGLLGAGGIAVAASVARLVMLLRIGGGDATVSTVDINLLGAAETSIGLICASIPALNVLFSRYATAYSSRKGSGKSRTNTDLELGLANSRSKKGVIDKDASIMQWTYNEVEEESEAGHDRETEREREREREGVGVAM